LPGAAEGGFGDRLDSRSRADKSTEGATGGADGLAAWFLASSVGEMSNDWDGGRLGNIAGIVTLGGCGEDCGWGIGVGAATLAVSGRFGRAGGADVSFATEIGCAGWPRFQFS
jgi:hypothetical protein